MNKINIGIIGSGAMGAGIAQVAATAGYQVFIYDSNPEAINKTKLNLSAAIDKLVLKNKILRQTGELILQKINYINNLSELKNCELIIEAIVENTEIKQKLFTELEKIVSANCILASNTSSISITSIASACFNPSRFIGVHFFNPAQIMPLVEIIPGLSTKPEIVSIASEIISDMAKIVVLCKDTPGFIVNRIARPFYGEAMRIYEEGIADIATIDWAMKEFGEFKMGPFELTDMIGHDVNYTVTESVWKQFYFDSKFKPSLCQKRLVEAKMFGRKTGKGFYDYAQGAPIIEPKKDKELGQEIFMRIISMLVNEAVDALYFKVASKNDIETAMKKGVNYPKGLLQWGDEIGSEKILKTLEDLYSLYADNRYRPSLLLKKNVLAGKKLSN